MIQKQYVDYNSNGRYYNEKGYRKNIDSDDS